MSQTKTIKPKRIKQTAVEKEKHKIREVISLEEEVEAQREILIELTRGNTRLPPKAMNYINAVSKIKKDLTTSAN